MDKKTECEIVQDLLLGYVDGVLNVESKKIVEKHILGCKECQTKLNEIKNDIEENDKNQKKQIDYLKKIRRKNNIKAIIIAIGIILFICLIIYLRKFIIVNDIMNKASKSLSSENFYIETIQAISSDKVALRREWYKDGKYKVVAEIYSDDGVKIHPTEYAAINTDEKIVIDHENKTVKIETGEFTKLLNSEKYIKNIQSRQDFGLVSKIVNAFCYSIHTSYRYLGREYYVLTNIFDKESNYEEWIDKDTGLTLKVTGNGIIKTCFEGTDIVKEVIDMSSVYRYEFNTVTDEDVTVPDYTGYEVQYINTNK